MLPTCATKALQGVARHVVTACHRYLFNCIGHLLHGNVDKAFGHHFGLDVFALAVAYLGSHGVKFLQRGLVTQRFICVRPKHFRKVAWLHFAQHHVGIGHGQLAAAPVAGRARVGARALRAYAKARAIKL